MVHGSPCWQKIPCTLAFRGRQVQCAWSPPALAHPAARPVQQGQPADPAKPRSACRKKGTEGIKSYLS
ncbi:hypothetical protein STRNTR1_1444 [Stenotrophomonas maltophilia]|nr:hypothetical protein STRNTR1_1444 [Stenotrophomonas maltophilia]